MVFDEMVVPNIKPDEILEQAESDSEIGVDDFDKSLKGKSLDEVRTSVKERANALGRESIQEAVTRISTLYEGAKAVSDNLGISNDFLKTQLQAEHEKYTAKVRELSIHCNAIITDIYDVDENDSSLHAFLKDHLSETQIAQMAMQDYELGEENIDVNDSQKTELVGEVKRHFASRDFHEQQFEKVDALFSSVITNLDDINNFLTEGGDVNIQKGLNAMDFLAGRSSDKKGDADPKYFDISRKTLDNEKISKMENPHEKYLRAGKSVWKVLDRDHHDLMKKISEVALSAEEEKKGDGNIMKMQKFLNSEGGGKHEISEDGLYGEFTNRALDKYIKEKNGEVEAIDIKIDEVPKEYLEVKKDDKTVDANSSKNLIALLSSESNIYKALDEVKRVVGKITSVSDPKENSSELKFSGNGMEKFSISLNGNGKATYKYDGNEIKISNTQELDFSTKPLKSLHAVASVMKGDGTIGNLPDSIDDSSKFSIGKNEVTKDATIVQIAGWLSESVATEE